MVKNYGDICLINGGEVEAVDCVIGGSPCFPSGTLVFTSKGFVAIEDVRVGDLVYTHKHRFRKVLAIGAHEDSVLSVKGNLSDFFCTPNHPIYSPDVSRVWDKNTRCYQRRVGEEKWVSACNMERRYWQVPNTFLGIPYTDNAISVDEAKAYFFGRWLGDGWCIVGRRKDRKSGTYASVVLCDSLDKEPDLVHCCACMTNKFSVEHQKSCVRVRFHNRALCTLLESEFGHGARNKTIPSWLLFSSSSCREALLRGLMDSDGYNFGDKLCYSTCSKSLAFSVRLLGESLGYSTSLFFQTGKGHSVIDGRKVLRTGYWMVSLRKSEKKPRFEHNGNSLYLVRKVSASSMSKCVVYNLSVEEDESYIADSVIVHNCQNLSVAGNRKGLEGSESRLFLDQMRVIKEMRQATGFQKPRYMVLENVVGLLSCNKGKDFQCVLNECVETALLGILNNSNKGTKDGEENCTEEDGDGRETGIPDVPMPKDCKWPKSGILYDDLGRWSIAWRIHDAQYWGVAQRRRRIALVCDFGGMSAPEVLFESQSVSGDLDTCNQKGERAANTSDGSIEESDQIWYGNGNGQLCGTLTGDHDNRITDYTNVVVQQKKVCVLNFQGNKSGCGTLEDDTCFTLNSMHGSDVHCVVQQQQDLPPCSKDLSYSLNSDVHESGLSVIQECSHTLKTTTKESVFVREEGTERRISENSSLPKLGDKSGQDYPCICIGNGQASDTEHYTEEISQTLNCMHDPMTILEPCAYQLVGVNSNSMKSSNPYSGVYETEQAGTITTNGCVPNNQGGTAIVEPVKKTTVYGICAYSSNCMKSSNPHSGVYEAETSRTLDTVSCGNPVCCQGGMAVVEPVIPLEGNECRESHKGDGWSTDQVSYTLNTVERRGIAYGETESSTESNPVVDQAAFNQDNNEQFDIKNEESDIVPSMVEGCPQSITQPIQYRVRRLTPLECTRLQGYPDGWVDIGDWIDSKGKKHKEADAPKYRALGNSIALPFWKWLCKNIVNQLKTDGQTTTMASLFDGIGGFPLCWAEATQSKDSVLWISEIEEFPLAITRHHFC